MEAVFLKVLELSLYGSLLILAVLPLRLLLGKAPKWVTCLLWAMVAVALICPVRFESPASVMPSEAAISQIVPAAPPAVSAVPTEPVAALPSLPAESDGHSVTPADPDYPAIGAAIWTGGMGLMLLYALVTVLHLRKRVGASLPVCDQIYLCDDIDTPFILGVFRPRIYLPSAIDEVTARQVLLHERAHLQRRDHWWKPLGFLLLTVHWFNPLVWVGYVLLCRDIELACDEKVVRDMAASDKKQYTEALLHCSVPRRLIAACPLAFGEVGVKQRIKAVLHYQKPAFWVIVIALVVCVVLCVGFLTDPQVVTLEELGDVGAAEISYIAIGSDARYLIPDSDALFEVLAQIELQPEVIKTPLDGPYHTIILERREGAAVYELFFSGDCTKLQLNRIVELPDGDRRLYDKHYKVLNPQLLTEADRRSLTTEHLDMDSANPFSVDAAHVTRVHANVVPDRLRSFSDSASIAMVCDLLNGLQLTRTVETPNTNPYISLQLVLSDQSVLYVGFNANLTKCWFNVYRMIDGTQVSTMLSRIYSIDNPDLLRDSLFMEAISQILPNNAPISLADFTSAVEASLNSGAVNWSAVELSNVFTQADAWDCVVSGVNWLNEDGEIPLNTSVFFNLTYENGSFRLEVPKGSGISAILPTDAPLSVKLTPAGSRETAVVSVVLDPATGEICSVVSRPAEQTRTPTAAELQTVIEEHLRNKNRYFKNLRLLGDVYNGPADGLYFLLAALDYTQADGTIVSENNLQLVSVVNMGSYCRVDSMVSGQWPQSAGIYPNLARFDGYMVLWTARSDTRMKVSEDGTSVDANSSISNDISQCRLYFDGAEDLGHLWQLQDCGGIFLLPEDETVRKLVPLDARGMELTALSFHGDVFEPVDVGTVSEESGRDLFVNVDTDELCGYPTVQSFPLYIDMDESFAGHEALYAAMKACDKLPGLSWTSVALAGQQTYEGLEYAVITYSEGRDTMAALIEYTYADDGTVTLRHFTKGYVPDEQGFLIGYRMNMALMGYRMLYWSLFDTRYAVSKDGTEVDHTQTTEPAFTSFRFTMRDLKTYDFPVAGDFFLTDFTTVIPPAIITPQEGKTLLAALGSEASSPSYDTITITE